LDYQPATATRVVERMIRRFGTDAEPVLAEFRERCGAAEPWPAPPVLNRLRDALLDLRFADGRDTLRVTTRPLLALFGGEDPIVTPAMAAHAFADARDITIEWEEAAGHLLPLTHPEWCASMIRRFLAARGFA
jgi:pimeloyl-[acyl-carrier protein] methyl ester esterase